MHAPLLLLASLQLLSLDEGLAKGREEKKPVLVYFHGDDWAGEEKSATELSEALGSLAEGLVGAHVPISKDAEAGKSRGVTSTKAELVVLDPFQREAKDQPLGRYVLEGSSKPAELKAAVEKALAAWKDHEGARAAMLVCMKALHDGSFEAFKKSICPSRVEPLGGDSFLKMWFGKMSGDIKRNNPEFVMVCVTALEIPEYLDPKPEGLWTVSVDLKSEGAFLNLTWQVARTKDGWGIWER